MKITKEKDTIKKNKTKSKKKTSHCEVFKIQNYLELASIILLMVKINIHKDIIKKFTLKYISTLENIVLYITEYLYAKKQI